MYVNESNFPLLRSDATPDLRHAHTERRYGRIINCLAARKIEPNALRPVARPLFRLVPLKPWLGISSRRWGAALLAVTAMFSTSPLAAKEYEFSYGPHGVRIQGDGWSGHHAFLDVYCVDFPDPGSVSGLEEGLLKGNAISYFRATYPGPTAAFIVTSTIPDGRSEAEEIEVLLENERRGMRTVNAAPPGDRYRVDTGHSRWGPVIRLQLSDILENPPAGPFPLARNFYFSDDERQRLRSAHRIFVKGSNRFEIAVLGALEATDSAEAQLALNDRLGKLADELLVSLQQCRLDSRR